MKKLEKHQMGRKLQLEKLSKNNPIKPSVIGSQFNLVRMEGLEPPRLAAPEPKSHEYLYKSKLFPTLRCLSLNQKLPLSEGELENIFIKYLLHNTQISLLANGWSKSSLKNSYEKYLRMPVRKQVHKRRGLKQMDILRPMSAIC